MIKINQTSFYPTMRIAVVIPSFYPAVVYGGTIFSSLNTCKEISKLGHEVFVSTTNTNMYNRLDVPQNKWIHLDGIEVKYYNETIVDKFSLRLCLSVWRDIKKADVVHIQAIYNTPIPISLFYAWVFRKPVLLSPRGVMGDWITNQGNRFKKSWLRFLIKPFASYVTWHATADQEKQEIVSHFPKAKVVVIPNGIDLEAFKHSNVLTAEAFMLRYAGVNKKPENIIVSMGRIHKKKGFDVLINAFFELQKNVSGCVLLIAGQDEGEKQTLLRQIEELQLQQSCFIIDSINNQDKIDFLSNADVFALTSHNENFGNVYAEALAAGTPIIASIHTPWKEVVEAGCGYWLDLTPNTIANAIQELLQSDKIDIEKKCKKYIAGFSWKITATRLVETYKKLIHD